MSVKFLKAYTFKQAKKIFDDAGLDSVYDNGKLCAEIYNDYLYNGHGYFIKWRGFDLFHLSRSFKFEIYSSLYNIPTFDEKPRFVLRQRFTGNCFIRYSEEFNIFKDEIVDDIKNYVVREHNKQLEEDLSILDDDESQLYKTSEDQMNEFMELLSKWVESQTY